MLARLVCPSLASSLVVVLHLVRRPPAVVRTVLAVVVNAINAETLTIAMRKRPSAEGLEVFTPFVTDEDAARPVVLELLVGRVVATSLHRHPDVIQQMIVLSDSHLALGLTLLSRHIFLSKISVTT